MNRLIVLCLMACLVFGTSCEQSSSGNEGANKTEAKKEKKKKKNSGTNKTYRDDGSLLSQVTYEDGVKHGTAYNYYPSGKVHIAIDYVEGKKEGKHYYNYQDGNPYTITDYKNDKKDGFVEEYRRDGKLKYKIPYKAGFPGVGFEEYSTSGNLKSYLKDLKLVVREKNTVSKNGMFSLYLSLSSYSNVKSVYYYVGDLTEGKYLNDGLEELYTENKQAEYFKAVKPGESLNRTITASAEVTLKDSKHPLVLKKTITVK